MSPEQAKGKMVDKRADLWAFGVLLFEMLTGRQLFSGETVSEILAAVLLKEPDFSKLPATLHPRIRLLLERCLEKEVKDRYSSAADVRVDIQKAFNAPSGALFQQSPAAQSAKTLRKMLPWIAATAILGVIAGGLAVWMLKGPEQHQVIRFDHEIAGDQKFANIPYPILAVSPDGKKVAYSTSSGGLFLRSMNEMTAKRISDPGENTSTPFFSPDSQWIGYWSMTDFKLKKISINGGAPIALCDASDVVGASWSADSAIVFASMGKGIMRISPAGGVPEVLIDSKTEPFYHPRLLPDKKSLLFTVLTAEGYKIGVKSLKSAERKILFPGDCAWYLPTGYIVYALEYNLFVVPFDLGTLQVTGATAPMADPIWRFGAAYAPQYAVSDSGTLAYLPQTTAASTPERILVWVDRQGKEEPIKLPVNAYNNPRISPDGRKVALVIGTQNQNIWIGDLTRGNLTRLTFEGGNDIVPLWTPDGKRIVFASNRAGYYSIYAKAADGTGDIEKFGSLSTQMNYIPSCWAASSKTLMITYMESSYNVGALSEGNDQVLKPLLNGKQNEMVPNVSPDGRWIAYTSNESGRGEVFVRPFPEVNKGKWQASTSGGSDPLWSPDGRELFYRAGESIMVVPVKTDRVFSLETPKELFQGSYVQSNIAEALGPEFHPWDISPDGRRLLMMKEPKSASPSGTGPRKINIVLNWLDELKQRVPVK
jgi:serine/threonine-protein kinase